MKGQVTEVSDLYLACQIVNGGYYRSSRLPGFLRFCFGFFLVFFFVSEGNIQERKQAGRKGRNVD